jgi:hypothetical protein
MLIQYIKYVIKRLKEKKKDFKPPYIEGSLKNTMNLLYKMNLNFKKCSIILEHNNILLEYYDANVDNGNFDIKLSVDITLDKNIYTILLIHEKISYLNNSANYTYSNIGSEDNFEVLCSDTSNDITWSEIYNYFENLNTLKQNYLFETFLLNLKTDYKLLRDEKIEKIMEYIKNTDND